jgi:ABC-2 type transport system ATP-binding protein
MLSLVEDLGRNQGKNIILCSHLLPDVEKTCDHVVVVVQGRVALQGSIAELTAADEARIRVEVEEREDEFAASLQGAGMLTESSDVKGLIVTVPHADDADAICSVAADGGFHLRTIDPVRSTLEQIFLQAVDGADVSQTAPAAEVATS